MRVEASRHVRMKSILPVTIGRASKRCGATGAELPDPPVWLRTYFEPSILAEETASGEYYENVGKGFKCDEKVSGTKHVLRCSGDDDIVYGGGFVMEPTSDECPKATIVFVHGLVPLTEPAPYLPFLRQTLMSLELAGIDTARIRIVYPVAPARTITSASAPSQNSSKETKNAFRGWYDVLEIPRSLDPEVLAKVQIDRMGLFKATQRLYRIVEEEYANNGIPSEQIVLMGHSLGSSVVVETALATETGFAATISISGFASRIGDIVTNGAQAYGSSQHKSRITWIHGTRDTIVDPSIAMASKKFVEGVCEQGELKSELIMIEGADHAQTLFQTPALYEAIVGALGDGVL